MSSYLSILHKHQIKSLSTLSRMARIIGARSLTSLAVMAVAITALETPQALPSAIFELLHAVRLVGTSSVETSKTYTYT